MATNERDKKCPTCKFHRQRLFTLPCPNPWHATNPLDLGVPAPDQNEPEPLPDTPAPASQGEQVKRYEVMGWDDDGEFCLFSDHYLVVSKLKEELRVNRRTILPATATSTASTTFTVDTKWIRKDR